MTSYGDLADIPFLRAIDKELQLLPKDPKFLEKLPSKTQAETQVGSINANTARILQLYHSMRCEAWMIERRLNKLAVSADSVQRKKLNRRLRYIMGFTDQLWTFLLVLLVSESINGPIALRQGGVIVLQKNKPFKTQREIHHETALARATLH